MNIATVPPYSRVVCPGCNAENRVKKQFGPYILSRRHAIGGMSSVFIANDETLGREVALKILSEEYSSDEKRIAAFEEEARLTASFSHPNVVRVFTTGRAFGRFYIAMEFVPGGHFEKQIRERGQIPETELLPLAIQVADGLKGAQSAGLIHRDVKPGNILLDAEGNAKIVDFGLALVTKGGQATASEIWATPYYVPPEAIEGGAEDFRADIYAFGATLYHALAGKPPCDEESMATDVLREAKRRIVPLKKAAPHLLDETCAVIDRAMAYEPIHRFGSYDDMIAGLKAALKAAHGEGVRDEQGVSKAERRLQLRRQKKQKTFAVASAVVLALAGLGAIIAVNASNDPGGKSKPKPKVVDIEQDGGQESASEIAARYRAARAAMESGAYMKAESEFSALLADDKVQEPTRTWAGLEAIVAAMADGKMDAARKNSSAARDHLKASPAEVGPGFRTGVEPVLDGFRNFEFFPAEMDLGSQGNERYMGMLIAGLKNWEQGGLDQARPFLRAVASESSLGGDPVLAWYQELAQQYLADYDILKSGPFGAMPETPEACREAIEELNRVLTLVNTKGRTRFNIRARQLDLAKLQRALANPASPPEEPKPDLLAEIGILAKAYRFTEIVDMVTKSKGDPPDCKRESILGISQSALVFLSEIEADLGEKPVNLPVKLKDGTDVSSLVMSEGKLVGKLADGAIRDLNWTDFPTDQLIELHRELVKSPASEIDRLRRHESAIAFEWLAGDRERAITAAARLSEESESFKGRWDTIAGGLPD